MSEEKPVAVSASSIKGVIVIGVLPPFQSGPYVARSLTTKDAMALIADLYRAIKEAEQP